MQTPEPGSRALILWRAAQLSLLVFGAVLVGLLFLRPTPGINLFWNLLIPIAPALLVFLPGLWRNICPMATMSLLPRHLGFSKRLKVPQAWVGPMSLIGLTALLILVPMRHLIFNMSGPATGLMLGLGALAAFITGYIFEWRSGWCSSLCPIHPVEKLYGTTPLAALPNAHCFPCERCTTPCPDSTKSMTPAVSRKSPGERLAGQLLVGGFVGFIWGWSHIQDMHGIIGTREYLIAFGLPLGGFALSYGMYFVLGKAFTFPKTGPYSLSRYFAVAAGCCYYWYRLPALFGVGLFPDDGVLIDLSGSLPAWSAAAMQFTTTSLIVWFMVLRKTPNTSWSIRPPYAEDISKAPAPAPHYRASTSPAQNLSAQSHHTPQ